MQQNEIKSKKGVYYLSYDLRTLQIFVSIPMLTRFVREFESYALDPSMNTFSAI